MGIDLLHSPTVVSSLIFATFVAIAIFWQKKQEEARHRKNGFAPPVRYRTLDPFIGLDYVVKVFSDVSNMQRNRLKYGKTFMLKPLIAPPSIARICRGYLAALMETMAIFGGETQWCHLQGVGS